MQHKIPARKILAVLMEIEDKAWDELENNAWPITFPLVPFPYHNKHREESHALPGVYTEPWMATPLGDVIEERVEIIEMLAKEGVVDIIDHPVVDWATGKLKGTSFQLNPTDEAGKFFRESFHEFKEEIRQKYDAERAGLSKFDFDPLTCKIQFRGASVRIGQKKGQSLRCRIMAALWERRHVEAHDKRCLRNGRPLSMQELAQECEIAIQDTASRTTADRRIRDAIHDLRKMLKKLQTPARIEAAGEGFVLRVFDA